MECLCCDFKSCSELKPMPKELMEKEESLLNKSDFKNMKLTKGEKEHLIEQGFEID